MAVVCDEIPLSNEDMLNYHTAYFKEANDAFSSKAFDFSDGSYRKRFAVCLSTYCDVGNGIYSMALLASAPPRIYE